MAVDVTVPTVEPSPTAVVVAATTWAQFPRAWRPMLDEVWAFLRGDAPQRPYKQGHNVILYKDDVPNVRTALKIHGTRSRSYCSGLTTLSIGMELSGVNCTTEPGRGAWITMPSPA